MFCCVLCDYSCTFNFFFCYFFLSVFVIFTFSFYVFIVLSMRLHNKEAVPETATIMPPPLQVDLKPIDLESGVRVTCDVGFLSANFSLPRPLLLISKTATLGHYMCEE